MFIWKELENVPQMFFQSLFISSYKTSYMLLFIAIVSLPHWGHDNERVIKYMLTHIDFLGLHEASKKIQNTYNIKFLRSRWMQHLNKWFGNLYASHLLQYVAIDPCMDGFSFFKTNVLQLIKDVETLISHITLICCIKPQNHLLLRRWRPPYPYMLELIPLYVIRVIAWM